jgi:hypothetical protein
MKFKRMKPIQGTNSRKSKLQRVTERIPNEERLLEWLANELPEHRLRLLAAVEPYLKFKLSPGFDRGKLADMPHVPLEGSAIDLEAQKAYQPR